MRFEFLLSVKPVVSLTLSPSIHLFDVQTYVKIKQRRVAFIGFK